MDSSIFNHFPFPEASWFLMAIAVVFLIGMAIGAVVTVLWFLW